MLGDIFGILVLIAVMCFAVYFVLFVIYKIISSINYFFKWRKWTPAERAYENEYDKDTPAQTGQMDGGHLTLEEAEDQTAVAMEVVEAAVIKLSSRPHFSR